MRPIRQNENLGKPTAEELNNFDSLEKETEKLASKKQNPGWYKKEKSTPGWYLREQSNTRN